MQRIFFSNLVLMIFLNLLIKPLALFGIDATVQNRVGAAEYGFFFLLGHCLFRIARKKMHPVVTLDRNFVFVFFVCVRALTFESAGEVRGGEGF